MAEQAASQSLPLSVWVTGEPVPAARALRGSFADMIRAGTGDAWPGPWSVVDCVTEDPILPLPGHVAGIVITGSPAHVADQTTWMVRVQDALRQHAAQHTPILGICFGHQLLGMALGGRSGPNPRGREIGTVSLTLQGSDELLGDAAAQFPVPMTHQDTVLQLPQGAQLIGSTRLDRNAAVRFTESVWGVQFHPEMDAELIAAYIDTLQDALKAEGLDPQALLADLRDMPESAALLPRFARHAWEKQSMQSPRTL